METTIYTHHTIQTAAAELARLYMKTVNQQGIILGFDAHGEIAEGYNNITSLPELIIKGEHSTLGDLDEDADEDDVIEYFEWALEMENSADIVFGCKPELVDTDTDTDTKKTDMNEYIIKRDNKTSLNFNGELIASAASDANNYSGSYSGTTGRWTELELYRTAGSRYVAVQVGRTQWQGEHDRYSASVCATATEVVDYLGLGWLAKELYDAANIVYSEQVD